jgi:hypothetical protein
MRAQLLWLIAACTLAQGGKMTVETPPEDLRLPTIIVRANPRYLLGLPLVVSVTFDNPQRGARLFELPELSVLFTGGSIGVQLQPVQGGARIGFPPSDRERGPRMAMEPGEQREMLLDLTNFGLDLPPGAYWMTVMLQIGRYSSTSQPVKIELVKPSPTDETESTRLRRLGSSPKDTGAWAPFLKANLNTVTVSPGLSAEAHQQLALHLFLHRALYGPAPVANLDITLLGQITSPILQSEVTVLRWEIQAAHTEQTFSPGAPVPAGMRFRLERIKNGKGFLTQYRKAIGAEQEFVRPPAAYPYK